MSEDDGTGWEYIEGVVFRDTRWSARLALGAMGERAVMESFQLALLCFLLLHRTHCNLPYHITVIKVITCRMFLAH